MDVFHPRPETTTADGTGDKFTPSSADNASTFRKITILVRLRTRTGIHTIKAIVGKLLGVQGSGNTFTL